MLIDNLKRKYPNELQFINAVEEFIESLDGDYSESVMNVLINPQRTLIFSVPWIDRYGLTQVNTGYRVQYNNALGPYKGGIRFDPSVNLDVMKFLAFEQTFKNALTGLPLGGAKGGSDFNPKGKTDAEILSFCQSFINQTYQILGPSQDVPAGDIGVGQKEIGYMFGQYKTLSQNHSGVFTGKAPIIGGALGRTEATGYGLLYIVEAFLKHIKENIKGKKVIISGSGQVAIHAAYKAVELGALVVAMSDRSGYIYNEEGLDIRIIQEHKSQKKSLESLSTYEHISDSSIWSNPCDIALPCATQSELNEDDIISLEKNNCIIIAEGANRPLTREAVRKLEDVNIAYIPGKAANAGGVAVSGLEMSQNAQMTVYSFDQVDNKLQEIMNRIFTDLEDSNNSNNFNYIKQANILSYNKLHLALISQGLIIE